MKKENIEEDITKEEYLIMEEYTKFLKKYPEKCKSITKVVFKITARIYKAVRKGTIEK